jgi:hypothetical protein
MTTEHSETCSKKGRGGRGIGYKLFTQGLIDRHCWELDAMDPNALRDSVEQAIIELIEPVAWQRCEVVNAAEQASLRTVLDAWGRHEPNPAPKTRR